MLIFHVTAYKHHNGILFGRTPNRYLVDYLLYLEWSFTRICTVPLHVPFLFLATSRPTPVPSYILSHGCSLPSSLSHLVSHPVPSLIPSLFPSHVASILPYLIPPYVPCLASSRTNPAPCPILWSRLCPCTWQLLGLLCPTPSQSTRPWFQRTQLLSQPKTFLSNDHFGGTW